MVSRRLLAAQIAILLALAATVAALRPESARGSYAGQAGALAFTVGQFILDPYNGDNSQAQDLYAVRAPSPRRLRLVHCTTAGGVTAGEGSLCPVGTPAFSPDGRQLVFAQDFVDDANACANTGQGQISTDGTCVTTLAIADADGGHAQALARLTSDDEQPEFLPDGRTLVFAGRARPSAQFDLYTVMSSGGNLTRLTRFGAAQPAPCANGSIAFTHRGNVYLLSADHRTRRQLTLRGGSAPDCSPNGGLIAFVRHRDLYVISATGTGLRRLSTNHVPTGRAAFAPGGHVLAGRPAFSPTGRAVALLSFGCPSHRGHCCPGLNDVGCVEQTDELDVVDLRGRVESTVRAGGCYDDGEGSQSCVGVGGVAWQALNAPYAPG